MTALFIATQRHSHLQPEYALKDDRTRIGRHPENDIAIMLESISRFHAEVVKQGNFYIVQDCQSRNGTYLNGDRLSAPCPIRQGDRIQFGNVEFIFRLSELSEPSAQGVTDTNVTFNKRAKHNVLKTKPVAGVQKELARAAEHEGKGSLSASVSTLYRILLHLREANVDDAETMREVLVRAFDVVPADRGAILMNTGESGALEAVAWHRRRETKEQTSPRIEISSTICERAAQEHAAILVSDASDDARFKGSDSLAGEEISSAICVPLMEGAASRGVLYCDTQKSGNVLSEADLAFMGTVAAEISYALWSKRAHGGRATGSGEHRGILAVASDDLHHAGAALEKVLQQCTSSSPMLSQALLDGDDVAAKGAWKQVKTGLKRLNKVLAEMMNYSQPPAPQLATVDVNRVVGETIEAFAEELRQAKIEVLTELRSNIERRCLDEEALYRSLINVVENAYDALLAQKGGRITVKSYETSQGALIIEVIDNGPGIEASIQARAFQPFNAGTGSRGIGMGLAMTRRLLEGMDGSVTLSSEPGRGTTVTVIFSPSTRA